METLISTSDKLGGRFVLIQARGLDESALIEYCHLFRKQIHANKYQNLMEVASLAMLRKSQNATLSREPSPKDYPATAALPFSCPRLFRLMNLSSSGMTCKVGLLSLGLTTFFRQTGHLETPFPGSRLCCSPAIRASIKHEWQKRWPI